MRSAGRLQILRGCAPQDKLKPNMPRILVTNDDGIYSEGIRKLAKALASLVGQHFSFDPCVELAVELVRWFLQEPRDPQIILNVNFPAGEFKGVRVTKLGKRIYSEAFIERLDPRGRKYYWIGAGRPTWQA